jgi:hypothetical protein
MACALPPSVPDDVVKKDKELSQVKDEVELKLQEISNGLPFVVFDGREIPFGDEDLDVVKVFTLDAKVVVDGASQTPLSISFAILGRRRGKSISVASVTCTITQLGYRNCLLRLRSTMAQSVSGQAPQKHKMAPYQGCWSYRRIQVRSDGSRW